MRTRPDALFLAAVATGLLPVIWFSHLPSGDGPSHVYNASLIARYFFDPADPVRRFLEFNGSFPPNLLAHGLLASLMAVMSPNWAERVLVGAYVVLLPLSLRYAMRAVSRETHGVEFLGLPVVFNMHVHWGFYNFLAGLVASLFALGYWLRIREQPGAWSRVSVMALLGVVVYLAHPVPLLELWLAMGFLWFIAALRTRSWRFAELRLAALTSLPALGLYVHYTLARRAGPPVPIEWPTFRYAASTLVRLYPLATYTVVGRAAALTLSMAVAAAIVWAWKTRAAHGAAHDYLVAGALLALLVFAAPTQAAGGTLITSRLVYFPLFFALMWLATVKWPASYAMAFMVFGFVLATAGEVSRWAIYERYDARMTRFLELAASRDGKPVEFFQSGSARTTVQLDASGTPYVAESAWGYAAIASKSVLLSDYEAIVGTFPFRFRPGASAVPYALAQSPECGLRRRWFDAERYNRETGLTVDTRVMWIDADRAADETCLHTDGRALSAERRSVDGKLLWLDARQ